MAEWRNNKQKRNFPLQAGLATTYNEAINDGAQNGEDDDDGMEFVGFCLCGEGLGDVGLARYETVQHPPTPTT